MPGRRAVWTGDRAAQRGDLAGRRGRGRPGRRARPDRVRPGPRAGGRRLRVGGGGRGRDAAPGRRTSRGCTGPRRCWSSRTPATTSGTPSSTRCWRTGRRTPRASSGCCSPADRATDAPPTALALVCTGARRDRPPAHRRHLGGQPVPRRPGRPPRAGAVAPRRRQDAVLRREHGRLPARAPRSAPTTSSSPPWRGSCSRGRRRRSRGPPAARCTPRPPRPASCPAPRSPGCSSAPRPTAGRRRAPAAPSTTCTPPTPCGCSRACAGPRAVHTLDGVRRTDAGLTARVQELLAR